YLLEFEFVGPRDGGAPNQLIDEYHHTDHRGDAPGDGSSVARTGGRLQVRSEARQAKIALAEHEHFASHQEEPAAGYRDHGVPHQSDGALRQFQLQKSLEFTE